MSFLSPSKEVFSTRNFTYTRLIFTLRNNSKNWIFVVTVGVQTHHQFCWQPHNKGSLVCTLSAPYTSWPDSYRWSSSAHQKPEEGSSAEHLELTLYLCSYRHWITFEPRQQETVRIAKICKEFSLWYPSWSLGAGVSYHDACMCFVVVWRMHALKSFLTSSVPEICEFKWNENLSLLISICEFV